MELEEQSIRLNRIISGNQYLENLSTNDDFNKWKETVVLGRIDSILEAIKSIDRNQPNWKDIVCDAVVAYQEAIKTYEVIFGLAHASSVQARKTLSELSNTQG